MPKKDKDTESTKHKKSKQDKHANPESEADTTTSTEETALEATPFKERDAQKAYEKHLEACEAVPAKTAISPIFSVSDAIFLGLMLAKHAEEDKKRLKKLHEIGEINYDLISQLYTLSLALWYAEARWQNARNKLSKTPKKTVSQSAKDIRKELLDAADYVWRNDPETKETLKQIREGSGLRDLAEDLQRLVSLFLDGWHEAEGRCSITQQDLHTAKELALDVLELVFASEQKEALLLRNQTFVLFQQAYEETCEAGRFLHRKATKEATERYPRLHKLKKNRKKTSPTPTPQPPTDTPSPQ